MKKAKPSKIIKWIVRVVIFLVISTGAYFFTKWEIVSGIFPSDSSVILLMLMNVPLLYVLVFIVYILFTIIMMFLDLCVFFKSE